MTIHGDFWADSVEESLFKVEHLERILEQMKEQTVLKDVQAIDWDAFRYFCKLFVEDKPESIENE